MLSLIILLPYVAASSLASVSMIGSALHLTDTEFSLVANDIVWMYWKFSEPIRSLQHYMRSYMLLVHSYNFGFDICKAVQTFLIVHFIYVVEKYEVYMCCVVNTEVRSMNISVPYSNHRFNLNFSLLSLIFHLCHL